MLLSEPVVRMVRGGAGCGRGGAPTAAALVPGCEELLSSALMGVEQADRATRARRPCRRSGCLQGAPSE